MARFHSIGDITYSEVSRQARVGDLVHITKDRGTAKSTYGKVKEVREYGEFTFEHIRGDYIEDNYVEEALGDVYKVLEPIRVGLSEGSTETGANKTKPPLGITPRFLLDEKRMDEIAAGIARYTSVYKAIPTEWIEEYNELAEREASRKE